MVEIYLSDKNEDSYKKVKQKKRNKTNHIVNGNRKENKEKKFEHYKVMSLNKGNSDLQTHETKLKHMIYNEKLISE